MNVIDFLIVFLIILTIVRGMDIGLVRQASSLLGLVIGLFVSSLIASLVDIGPVASLVIIGVGLLGAIVGSEYLGVKLKKSLHEKSLNKVDRFFGAALGGIICLAFVWFCAGVLPFIPSSSLGQAVRDSKIIRWLDDTLPPTTSIVRWLEHSFEQTKIPEIVNELEPQEHNAKGTIPDVSQFQDVIKESRNSVVEIEGRSCAGIGVGSGFVVAPNYIVTNAHVVAGMRSPYAQDTNGRHKTEIVAFDSSNDLAILKTERLEGKSLTIKEGTVSVGESGVTLGYPEGRAFTAQPAVVVERFTALGKDIYEQNDVRRDVYALKSAVEPGNSGGPLINKSGEVIGVVFARSTTNTQIGYALSTPPVHRLLAQAQSQPSSGSSLRCTP